MRLVGTQNNLNSVVRKDFIEKIPFEQKLEGDE